MKVGLNRTAGEMSPDAIESLLHEQIVARIAYLDRRGNPCIVPINYAYDGDAFYGYSLFGAKIEGMSAHPGVCVEVDRVDDSADWWSVVARGTFDQLTGSEALAAVERISDRLRTYARADRTPEPAAQTYVTREGGPGVAYRIRITHKRGRYSAS
jgi:uncharacterized protein